MGYLLQNDFGALKDTMVHLGAQVHQAVTSLFEAPTILKVVLHEVTFFHLKKVLVHPGAQVLVH